MIEDITKAFIPLFVSMDTLGLLPLFLGLTQGIEPKPLKTLTYNATFTAFLISILFLFTGSALFVFLGITANDFRIGGGVLLIVLAIQDLTTSQTCEKSPHVANVSIGVVPIGIPLIMGPAALTTILILVDAFGIVVTLIALLANFLVVLVVLLNSRYIIKVMGEAGSQAFAKVAALFMAGIAIMMIRSGIEGALK